jgi:DNA recombination-dependent growth factor C
MGIYTGAASYQRYRTGDKLPDNIKEFVLEKLKEFPFKEINPATITEKSMGWVSAENMASTFFDDMHFSKEPYLVFALRVDTRRIPALAAKAAFLGEEIKFKENTGKDKLAKHDRDMLKEEVWQSLLKKALPTPVVYDVCWNTKTEEIFFFSNSKSANDEFITFFYRSFDVKLVPLVPYDLAEEIVTKQNKSVSLKNLRVDFVDG